MIQPLALSDIQQASGVFHISDQNLTEIGDGFNFGSAMVPEPTSGLLLLVGGALLALRADGLPCPGCLGSLGSPLNREMPGGQEILNKEQSK